MDNTIDKITDSIFIPSSVDHADIAIVLGNDHIETMNSVASVYHDGFVKKILITGHSKDKDKVPESDRFFERAVELGIKEEDIILEKNAANTKENFIFSKEILDKNLKSGAIKKVMIVCLAFHSRRALLTARKWLSNEVDYVFLTTIDKRNIGAETWHESEISKKRVLEELERIGGYTIKGDLEI